MLIIAGHIVVVPAERDEYVAGCVSVVKAAQAAPGCLHFSITADSVETTGSSIYERWQGGAHLLAFRGSGPSPSQQAAIIAADVKRDGISSVGDP